MDGTLEPVTGPKTEPSDHGGRDIDVRRGREVVGTHEPITLREDFAQARGSELLSPCPWNLSPCPWNLSPCPWNLSPCPWNLSATALRCTGDDGPRNDVRRYTFLFDVEVLSHYLRLVMIVVGPHGAHDRPLLIVSILTPKFQQLINEFRLLEPCIVPNMQHFRNLVQFPGRLFQQLLFSEVHNPLPSFVKWSLNSQQAPDRILERAQHSNTRLTLLNCHTCLIFEDRISQICKIDVNVGNASGIGSLKHCGTDIQVGCNILWRITKRRDEKFGKIAYADYQCERNSRRTLECILHGRPSHKFLVIGRLGQLHGRHVALECRAVLVHHRNKLRP